VLVMDAEPMVRGMFARILRPQPGYRVLEASGVQEAQYLATVEARIHLLILKLKVPEANELEFGLCFRNACPKTHVLIASSSLESLSHRVGDTKQISFLAEPFTAPELVRIVRRILEIV
jgi:DNA-binding NarL/FixJ family response regulator